MEAIKHSYRLEEYPRSTYTVRQIGELLDSSKARTSGGSDSAGEESFVCNTIRFVSFSYLLIRRLRTESWMYSCPSCVQVLIFFRRISTHSQKYSRCTIFRSFLSCTPLNNQLITTDHITTNGAWEVIFRESPLHTVKLQFFHIFEGYNRCIRFQDFIVDPPIRYYIDTIVSLKVERCLISCELTSILRKELNRNGVQSFVFLLKIYGDKFKTSIKRYGMRFYPLHVFVLNFTERLRKALTLPEESVFA